MKTSLLKSLFSTGLQAIALQVMGVLFFLLVSLYLPKDSFGIIIWSNGVAIMITSLLSFGLEQVVTRRIAASDRSDWAAAAFLFHSIAGSTLSFLFIFLLSRFQGVGPKLQYLPWFFLAQAVIYMALPLRQYLNAKQKFTPYGVIAILANFAKIGLAFMLLKFGLLSVATTAGVLVVCALMEFVLLFFFIRFKTPFRFSFRKSAYYKLIKESFPLYITAVFDAVLKRADSFLLGVISTNATTGDYGFAYRAFEMAALPVFIVGPIILAKFARLGMPQGNIDEQKQYEIRHLFRIEIFFAVFIPLIANFLWSPVLDVVSDGKYGEANATEFFILSLCIPFQFAINLFWTLNVTSRKYKMIGRMTAIAAISNLLLNLMFIPWLGAVGAAVAFFITTIILAGSYYYTTSKEIMKLPVNSLLLLLLLGVAAYCIGRYAVSVVWLQILIAIAVYVILSLLLKQVGKNDLAILKTYVRK